MPIGYLGTKSKACWVLEAAALPYLHLEFPSLSFVLIKLSPGAGLGEGVLCPTDSEPSLRGKMCFAALGTSGNIWDTEQCPNTKNHTMGTVSKTQLVNSKC